MLSPSEFKRPRSREDAKESAKDVRLFIKQFFFALFFAPSRFRGLFSYELPNAAARRTFSPSTCTVTSCRRIFGDGNPTSGMVLLLYSASEGRMNCVMSV